MQVRAVLPAVFAAVMPCGRGLARGDGLADSCNTGDSVEQHLAGIYYTPGSLKATLCMDGRARLYEYCRERGVPHKAVGKLLVAVHDGEVDKLHKLEETGRTNGVADLRRISVGEAKELEPNLHCTAALLSPSTGIVDSHR